MAHNNSSHAHAINNARDVDQDRLEEESRIDKSKSDRNECENHVGYQLMQGSNFTVPQLKCFPAPINHWNFTING